MPQIGQAQTTALEFPPPLCHAGKSDLLLFIHGWNGDSTTSWRKFPSLACSDPQLAETTVISLGYPTFMVQRNLTIDKIAAWINQRLLAYGFANFKRVTIIAHSIGGLIARDMVLQLAGNSQVAQTQIGMLIELGTPHNGAQNYAQLMATIGVRGSNIVEQVRPGSQFLAYLATHWNSLVTRPKTYCFTSPQDWLVSEESAVAQCDSWFYLPGTDHCALAKPESANDDRYRIPTMYVKAFFSQSTSNTARTPSSAQEQSTATLHGNSTNGKRTSQSSPRTPRVLEPRHEPGTSQPVDYCYLVLNDNRGLSDTFPRLLKLVVNSPTKLLTPKEARIVSGPVGPLDEVPVTGGRQFRQLSYETAISLSDKHDGDVLTFAVTPGTYTFEIRTNLGTLIEQLRPTYRNEGWVQVVDVSKDGKTLFATPKLPDQPDISLSVVNPRHLGLFLENTSEDTTKIIREPYYRVVLWDVSPANRRRPPMVWNVPNKDAWIRPKNRLATVLFSEADQEPQELYGYAMVTCPECVMTKTYMIYVNGDSGWFEQFPIGWIPFSTAEWIGGIEGDFQRRISLQTPNETRKPIVNYALY